MNLAYSKQSAELVKFIEIDLQNLMTEGNKEKLLSKYNLDAATLKSAKETEVRSSKKSAIESELKSSYQKASNEFEPRILKAVDNITKWNLFELHNSIDIVDTLMPTMKKKIEALYLADATKYEYASTLALPISKQEFELSKPMELLSKNGAYSLLLIVLLQHFLLLAPLFLTTSDKVYKTRKVGGGIKL
jgi:hypothetical protein